MGIFDKIKAKQIAENNSRLYSLIAGCNQKLEVATKSHEKYKTFLSNLSTLSENLFAESNKLDNVYEKVIAGISSPLLTSKFDKLSEYSQNLKKEKSNIDTVVSEVKIKIISLEESITSLKNEISTYNSQLM